MALQDITVKVTIPRWWVWAVCACCSALVWLLSHVPAKVKPC